MRAFTSVTVAGTAGGIAFYTIWVLSGKYDPQVEAVASSAGLILLSLFGGVFGLYIAGKKVLASPMRKAWSLIALALFSNLIAEVLWFYYESVLHIDPFPSPADVFYLLFYPLMLAGILSLPFTPVKQEQRFLLGLDLSIVMTVGALFLWYFVLAPLRLKGEDGLAGLIALAYPVADLFILAGLLSLIQRDMEKVGRAVLGFLSGGMLFMILADILFAILELYSISYSVPLLNILWMVSFWAILAAVAWQATHPVLQPESVETFHPLLRSALLYGAPVLGMGLVYINAVHLFKLELRLYGALVGSFALAALVLLRQYVVLRDNHRLYKEMEYLAVTDALTSLYNRHHFNAAIAHEIRRAERYGRPLSLLLMDVDNFKSYNDAHGHLQGDKLLREIAIVLQSQFRTSDLLARFGGDEFIAVLAETGLDQAKAVANKIEKTVAARFDREGLGISIGIAVLKVGMTPTALLAEADKELYRVKPDRMG